MAMFTDKVVLVTGGASGIGRAAALRFAEEGGRVAVTDLDGAGADKVAALIRERGGQAFGSRIDVSSEADNARMVAEAAERFGGLDVAFLNAGFLGSAGGLLGSDLANFDRVLSINLRGCYLGLKSVGAVIRRGGSIVVTASVGGITGYPINPTYSASKHGVIGLVRSSAAEFAERGVRINALCPGGVETGMTVEGSVADLGVSPDELQMPAWRTRARPEHIAEFALYLASARAAFITGSVQTIDGGLTANMG